jgi:N,N'-diacetylchitobiose transport system substrate-binding protein
VPTTLDEFVETGIALKEANADTPNFSGIYFPGKYWFAALPFIWQAGGDIAVKDGESWTGVLASDESIAGLEQVKTIMDQASGAPKDGDESKDYIAFCNGEIGMLMAPGWKIGQILNEDDGCPEMADKIGAFALPGGAAGETAPVFLGGSNLAISANSENQDLALDLIKIMVGAGYQEQFASAGTIPALKSLLGQVSGDAAAKAQATAAVNSRFVPSSENWAGIEASTVLPDMLVAIAQGSDVASEAQKANDAIVSQLNA